MSAEQMQAVMTQIQHLIGVVGKLAQRQQQSMQWQQQGAQQNPAVSPPGLGPYVKARKLIDTRFVKIPFIPGEGKDHEDWSFAFKRPFGGDLRRVVPLSGSEALQLVRTVDDMERFRAWSKLYRKYAPKTMARAIRMVGQVTNPPKSCGMSSGS